MIHLTDEEFFELAFASYWTVFVFTAFAAMQVIGIQPLEGYKNQGKIDTIEKKIGFYTIRVVFNVIAFLGGLMFVNMFTNLVSLIIMEIPNVILILFILFVGIIKSIMSDYYLENKDR